MLVMTTILYCYWCHCCSMQVVGVLEDFSSRRAANRSRSDYMDQVGGVQIACSFFCLVCWRSFVPMTCTMCQWTFHFFD
jgi:hypothetical protein